jgi:hypothetical protein
MAVRAEAMSGSPSTNPRIANHLVVRSVGAVFAVSLVIVGLGGALVWQNNRGIVPAVLSMALASGIGLTLGLGSRHMLRGGSLGLRIAAAWAAVIVGLILMGMITRGEAGLAFHDSRRPLPDGYGLLQVALGSLSALLALTAWSGGRLGNRTRAASSRIGAAGASRSPALTSAPAPTDVGITQPNRARRRPVRSETRPPPARPVRVPRRRTVNEGPTKEPRLPTMPRLGAWAKRVLPWRRRRIQLLGSEAHRCPYCLDPVERNDARGVVVCPVCHTRHHADCWAVTGMCQVPHYHR